MISHISKAHGYGTLRKSTDKIKIGIPVFQEQMQSFNYMTQPRKLTKVRLELTVSPFPHPKSRLNC